MFTLPKPEPRVFFRMSHKKRVDLVVKHYINLCTSGKITANSYFGLYRHFSSRPVTQLDACWEYLLSLTRKEGMDLKTFYQRAEEHRKRLIAEANNRRVAELNAGTHDEITLDDVLKL